MAAPIEGNRSSDERILRVIETVTEPLRIPCERGSFGRRLQVKQTLKVKMSHTGCRSRAPGLGEVLDILFKEPQERLLSLTILLGQSPEDTVIHALCLLILQREEQALDKLRLLGDDSLAGHLAEKWRTSGGRLEEFRVLCGDVQEFTGESLAVLARIFKVLTERRLCDPLLRDLAYQRAVSVDGQPSGSCWDLEYDQLREEAKVVCGPMFEQWMSSSRDVTLEPRSSPDETLTSKTGFSFASPLEASTSMPSFPTHIEVSIPTTALYVEDTPPPETPGQPNLSHRVIAPGRRGAMELPPTTFSDPPLTLKVESQVETAQNRKSDKGRDQVTLTTNPSGGTKCTLSKTTSLPVVPCPDDMHESEEEAEEAIFYAFVILHAPQDIEVAEKMRERLESISGCQGATFSEDFAVPGKSALRCLEDAINNSAFTVLLLTCNFNTRMLETKTETALINSINNKHKHNTVIPLIPRENALPRADMPMVLHTIIALEEGRSFERKVQRSLSQAKVKKQRQIWEEGQRLRSQVERQEQLKRMNQRQKCLIRESKEVQLLEREHLNLLMEQNLVLGHGEHGEGEGRLPSNIHISNAQYVIIGNDSQMTVDHCGAAATGDTVHVQDRQKPDTGHS